MEKERGLVSCIQEFKKGTALAPIFVTSEVTFDVLVLMMTGRLLAQGVEAGNMECIFYHGGIVVLMVLAALLLDALSGRYATRTATDFPRNLRRETYRNVRKSSLSNIGEFSTGGIITRLTTDVTDVQMAFVMIIRIAVRCPIMLICVQVLTSIINPRLALVFLVMIPILGLGLFLIITGIHPIFEWMSKRYDHLNSVVQEDLLGIQVAKFFVREEHGKERFGKVSQEIYMDLSKAEKLIAFNMPLMQLCVYACILTVSQLGVHLVVGGSVDVGQLTNIFSYIVTILISLMILSVVLVMTVLTHASAGRITGLLNEESGLRNGEDPAEEVKDSFVVLENVSFNYIKNPNEECLKNANLNIKSGGMVSILSGTGTSKTTLVQFIPQPYDVTEGYILVGSVDVRDYNMSVLWEQVAMVLQKSVLFSGTIEENLHWSKKDATDEEMVWVCKLAQVDPFIQEFPDKYDAHIGQSGSSIPGGQKQRPCIARALPKKSKILILDDSISAVDTKADAPIRKTFQEKVPDTTEFIIAQRIFSIEDVDKILVMDGGKISVVGTYGELLQSCGVYREIYESQTKGGSEDE